MEWANTSSHAMKLLDRIGPESMEKLAQLHFDSFAAHPQSSPSSEGVASSIGVTGRCDAVPESASQS
jgi:hypothetical protein